MFKAAVRPEGSCCCSTQDGPVSAGINAKQTVRAIGQWASVPLLPSSTGLLRLPPSASPRSKLRSATSFFSLQSVVLVFQLAEPLRLACI